MPKTLTSQKVQGFLSSPHTYPKGGLGFGVDAGAVSAARGDGPRTANKMFAQGTTAPMRAASGQEVTNQLRAAAQIKSAECTETKTGTGMLEKIKQLALEKCAGDEKLAAEFLEGFYDEILTKQAAFGIPSGDALKGAAGAVGKGLLGLGENAFKSYGEGLGKGLAGVTLGLGVTGLVSSVKSIQNDHLHTEFVAALRQAVSSNPIVRNANKQKVISYAETIFKFAPHVATDANLLSAILANAVHGEGIDPMTIKNLTDLESRYTTTMSATSFSPKAYA